MDIRDLEYLAAAAEAEHFGRSAEAFGVNVSTISRRIGRIEDELGLALFERGPAGVRLTAGGRAVMAHVRGALAEVEAAKRAGLRIGSGLSGEVRLGTKVAVGNVLGSLLERWREAHPDVGLIVAELAGQDVVQDVESLKLDVLVTPRHAVLPHAATAPLYREELLAVLPAQHPSAGLQVLRWSDLKGESVLVQGSENISVAQEFYGSALGGDTQVRPHAASKESLFALVRAGFGIAFATRSEAGAVSSGVIVKPINEPDALVEIVLAWRAELEDPVVGRFVACLRDEARSRRLC